MFHVLSAINWYSSRYIVSVGSLFDVRASSLSFSREKNSERKFFFADPTVPVRPYVLETGPGAGRIADLDPDRFRVSDRHYRSF